MKLLLDTNVFIPLEPTGESHAAGTSRVVELATLANAGKCQLWVHPAQRIDIGNDTDVRRRTARRTLLSKYPMPSLTVGPRPPGKTNDWVDDHLISAVKCSAVDFFGY